MGKFLQIVSCWESKLGQVVILRNHYQWRSDRVVTDNSHLTSTRLSIEWFDEHDELIKLL